MSVDQRLSTSQSLLARARGNDADAWDRLVDLYTPLVRYWCRASRLSDDDASDVLQEVFGAVAMTIGRFRKERDGDSFRGWLRTITRNKIHDLFRRQRREPRAAGGSQLRMQLSARAAPEPVDLESVDDDHGERLLFQRALELIREQFHAKTWNAFERTVIDERAPKDVAEELGMSPGAVRVAKSRVLRRLREELGDLL